MNLKYLKDSYPDLCREIKDKYGAVIDLMILGGLENDPGRDPIPNLIRGAFETGYFCGQRDAAIRLTDPKTADSQALGDNRG